MKNTLNKYLHGFLSIILICSLCMLTSGCLDDIDDSDYIEKAELTKGKSENVFKVNPKQLSFDGLTVAPHRAYTLLVYMNGTDLEADGGCATEDLKEIAGAAVDSEKINIIVLTGGTEKWNNDVVNPKATRVYSMKGGEMTEVANFGKANISDPATLTAFINYGANAFPADRYSIIFWNHGGGPIYGYGSDQKADEASLSISQIAAAMGNSVFAQKKAEFIGMDACMMATVETAQFMQNYAKYYIASEELEPGGGWNYSWLKALNDNPAIDTKELGKIIVDKFISSCEAEGSDGTLSVVDLSRINEVATAVDTLSYAAGGNFNNKQNLKTFIRHRKHAKHFGDMGEDFNFDVMDAGSYADCLSDMYPKAAEDVQTALHNAVVYSSQTSGVFDAYGLTVYSPFYETGDVAKNSAQAYRNLGLMANHTNMVDVLAKRLKQSSVRVGGTSDNKYSKAATKAINGGDGFTVALGKDVEEITDARLVVWQQLEKDSNYFVRMMVNTDVKMNDDGTITGDFSGYYTTYQGVPLYLRERSRSDKLDIVTYTSPAYLNGQKVNLIIRKDKNNKPGKIMYAVPSDGPKGSMMAAKGSIALKKGDKLIPRYWANLFVKSEAEKQGKELTQWVKGKEITVDDDWQLKETPVGSDLLLINFWLTDIDGNDYYSKTLEVKY